MMYIKSIFCQMTYHIFWFDYTIDKTLVCKRTRHFNFHIYESLSKYQHKLVNYVYKLSYISYDIYVRREGCIKHRALALKPFCLYKRYPAFVIPISGMAQPKQSVICLATANHCINARILNEHIYEPCGKGHVVPMSSCDWSICVL